MGLSRRPRPDPAASLRLACNEDFRDFVFRATTRSLGRDHANAQQNLNPRMNDGDTPWLSVDLRAFSTTPNAPPFTANVQHGFGLNASYDYINAVLQAYNTSRRRTNRIRSTACQRT
jgi:hypothetical protein